MVRDDEEIERTRQLGREPGRGGDHIAARELVGLARAERRPRHAGIEREGRVEVRVAEQRTGGEVAVYAG